MFGNLVKRARLLAALCLLLGMVAGVVPASAQQGSTTVTILAFSDYHAHAVPIYSEGAPDQGGLARGIAYLKAQRKADPNLLVLNGGDMFNKGSPTWSDEYKCTEWPWFDGLVDAMALGNHEFDYGQDVFKSCQASIDYPILSANYVDASGNPILLTSDGKPYLVKTVGGMKIGMFAMAGNDFATLVSKTNMPAGASFGDRVATAKKIIAELRDTEKVNAVVLFGHASLEDDTALAQAVPGIDLILGTHSHLKIDLMKIANTNTYYISPFQYLTYFSRVQMTFSDGKVSGVTGNLVKMDSNMPKDPDIEAQVSKLQTALEAKYPDRFKVLGTAADELSLNDVNNKETGLGNWSMEVIRATAGVNAFFSTSSSFRAAIPPGPITVEAFYTAIPYKNSIVTTDMTGQQLADFLNLVVSKRGTDSFAQESGVRFNIENGKATDVKVLIDPANPNSGYAPLDLSKTYKIGVTNFMSGVSGVYKPFLAGTANLTDTKIDIGTTLTDKIQAEGTISGGLDGRMSGVPIAQPGMPSTGQPSLDLALPLAAAILLLGLALVLVARRSSLLD